MKLKDITSGEKEQKTENESKYIPGSSEKKRACMMYLFFGIIVSLLKKEFSPFEFYHFKQSTGLWILILPIVLISFIPVLKWISILVLVVLLAVLGVSFANAFNGKYFDDSRNAVLALPSGIGGWFLDLFELGIKSTGVNKSGVNKETDNSNQSLVETSEIEKDIVENQNGITLDSLQTEETSLEEDVQTLDKKGNLSDDAENK